MVRKTQLVRAPRNVVPLARRRFPNLDDSQIYAAMFDIVSMTTSFTVDRIKKRVVRRKR